MSEMTSTSLAAATASRTGKFIKNVFEREDLLQNGITLFV